TRFLVEEVNRGAPISDLLGLVENLARRFAAHDSELLTVYFPAASARLTPEEWKMLGEAAPGE
ncbi:MAG TPA: hypothetical protein VKH43_12000, partial [Thermoanaerobaculia bacterium]|nr:hypothetical protein [Thermoanaerobaculia bacterium]